MKNSDMPAMPIVDSCGRPAMYGNEGIEALGFTKRERIAMHMMSALLVGDVRMGTEKDFATVALVATDALLAELERTK